MTRSAARIFSILQAHAPRRPSVLRASFLHPRPQTASFGPAPTRRHATASAHPSSSSSSSGSSSSDSSSRRRSLSIPYSILIPLLPILLVLTELTPYEIFWVSGPSMTPSFNTSYSTNHLSRDIVLVRRKHLAETLRRGMVVIFRSPMDAENVAVKRVIAVGGDRVTLRPGEVRAGRYVQTRGLGGRETVVVPWNHVWVEGDADDSRLSMDSNVYGVVSENLVTGVVIGVLGREGRWVDWEEWEESEVGEKQRARVEKEAVRVHEPLTF